LHDRRTTREVLKFVGRALLPGGAVLAAALMVLNATPAATAKEISGTYGLVVYGAGLALAWIFHRSRAFIALSILAWVDIAVVGEPESDSLIVSLGTVTLGVVGLLGLLRDRGVASRVGSMQLVVVWSVAALSWIVFADPARANAILARPEVAALGVVTWPGYPRVTLLVASLALVAVAYGMHRYRGPMEQAFLWSLVLLLAAMRPEVGAHGSSLLLMATGLTVALGVVETSYVMAYRDDLTGLPGRRALMQHLDGMQGTYTVAMVDVDHFKQFNDKHGHDVGDQVLQMVAKRLGRTRGGAKAFRYGGEEFTILLPGRTVSDARPYLEDAREAVADATFTVRSWRRPRKKPDGRKRPKPSPREKQLSVTVSIGAADSVRERSPEAILKKADEALYKVKRAGRDRVRITGVPRRRRSGGSGPIGSTA
jgi:diguanylate cyclase (GGDEF)-like protein